MRSNPTIKHVFAAILLMAVAFLIVYYYAAAHRTPAEPILTDVVLPPGEVIEPPFAGPSVQLGNGTRVFVELATSTAAMTKGLSGRPSLEAGHGMLFVFSKPDRYRFWMPDMRFSIDIIWIADGKVVHVTENASPDFDPEHPVFYTPPSPVQYVLEVNAGFARANNIQAGSAAIIRDVNTL